MDLKNITQCSLSEALRLYAEALESKDEIAIKTIEGYIFQNHSVTNATKLRHALEYVDNLDPALFTKEMKQELINLKILTFEIAEHLDPHSINNFGQLDAIVSRLLNDARRANEASNLMVETIQGYGEKFHNPH